MNIRRRFSARSAGLTALCLLVIARLWLTADRDILALNQPYDDYWFIFTARRSIWSGHYTNLAFAQLQMFALWLEGMRGIGVPARLGLDLWWLAGAGYLAFAVRRLCRSTWPGVVLFVFLAFHPYSIALFDRALAENLAASLVTITLAAFTDVWNFRAGGPAPSTSRQRIATAIGAVAFAAAYHTRKEGIVLLAPLSFLALWSLVHRTLWWGREHRGLGFGIIATPLIAMVAMGIVISMANAKQWGIFARYELAAPGYGRAMRTLAAIDPEGPTPKWVTVTAATRARAYEASPTFRELKPFLDGPMAASVVQQTELYSGVKGEIGNGWFYWTLRDAASMARWHVTAPVAEAHYNAMADEIEQAFERGTLRRRAVLIPFVDPDWRKWLPRTPAALAGEIRQALAPVPDDLVDPIENASAAQQDDYVSIAGRRLPFTHHAISGWLIAPAGTRVFIAAGGAPGPFTTLEGATRPDVPGAYSIQLHADAAGEAPRIMAITPDGTTGQAEFSELQIGKVNRLKGAPILSLGVDSLSTERAPPRANKWLAVLCTAWTVFGYSALAAGIVAVCWIGEHESSGAIAARLVLVLAIIGIGARVVLLAILDSSSWSGTQARYLLPCIPMAAVLAGVGMWKLGGHFASTARRGALGQAPT